MPQQMFGQSLLEGVGKTHRGWAVVSAFSVQVVAVLALISIPLTYTHTLRVSRHDILTAPPAPPPASTPQSQNQVHRTVKRPPTWNDVVFRAPNAIPPHIAVIIDDAPPAISDTGVVGDIPSIGGSGTGNGFSNISALPTAPPAPPKVAEVAKPTIPQRIRQGGDVQAASLKKKVVPSYPYLAKQAHVQGDVMLGAIISKDGTVQSLHLISGNPLLAPAALDAVRQWVYKPTLLNGVPVEVITEITVKFSLSQ